MKRITIIWILGGLISTCLLSSPSIALGVADTWTRKADMPRPRAYFSTSAVKGKTYAIGGATDADNSLSTVEEYDTGFLPREVEAEGKLATAWGKIRTKH